MAFIFKTEMSLSNSLFLGVNFVSHDTSVFGVCDNDIFAISEERFSRFKHDSIWPLKSLIALRNYFSNKGKSIDRVICGIPLRAYRNRISINKFEYETFKRNFLCAKYLNDFHEKEERCWGRGNWLIKLFRDSIGCQVSGDIRKLLKSFLMKPIRIWIRQYLKDIFGDIAIEVIFYDHHECHALSALATSGFEKCLVVTMDGWGDGAFTKVYLATHVGMKLICESRSITTKNYNSKIPNYVRATGIFNELSVGHAYSIVTWLLGFSPCADEGKVEALAAFGHPDSALLECFHSTATVIGGEIVINKENFISVFHSATFHERIRSLSRESVSATIQRFLENIYLELIKNLTIKYQVHNVCLAGGVAANVILNMKIFADLDSHIHVVPAMADDGTAMGAALLSIQERLPSVDINMLIAQTNDMPYYGTEYSASQTLAVLQSNHGLPIRWEWIGDAWPEYCARLICESGEIVALFQGRCEFGPRALGNRSIVADLRRANNTERLNRLVKSRPSFQPFCPSILDEELDRLFDKAYLNKHMTCAFRLRKEHAMNIPCAVHIDGTARVQFVTQETNAGFYQLLREIKRLTGYGGVLNTSFNKHGRTICESPLDAIVDFVDCNIDHLMLNGYLVSRSDTEVMSK